MRSFAIQPGALALSLLAISGCQTVGGPGVSSYFDCGGGERIQVTYGRGGGAALRINNARPILLKSVQGVGGSNFEGFGYRLSVMGDTATWSGLTREAPHQCRRVAVPR